MGRFRTIGPVPVYPGRAFINKLGINALFLPPHAEVAQLVRAQDSYPPRRTAVQVVGKIGRVAQLVRHRIHITAAADGSSSRRKKNWPG